VLVPAWAEVVRRRRARHALGARTSGANLTGAVEAGRGPRGTVQAATDVEAVGPSFEGKAEAEASAAPSAKPQVAGAERCAAHLRVPPTDEALAAAHRADGAVRRDPAAAAHEAPGAEFVSPHPVPLGW
jgi:hypothetical protein